MCSARARTTARSCDESPRFPSHPLRTRSRLLVYIFLPRRNTAALAPAAGGDDEEDATLKELAAGPAGGPARAPADPEKVKQKHLDRAKEKERAAAAAISRKEAEDAEAELGEDPGERAKKIRELQMRAEMEMAAAQFMGGPSSGKAVSMALSTDPEMLLAAVPLAGADSFTSFGGQVCARVHAAAGAKSNMLAMRFYNELLSAASERLSSTELSALIRMLETKERGRREAEKKASSKKPTKAKMTSKLQVGADFGACGARVCALSFSLSPSLPQTTMEKTMATTRRLQRGARARPLLPRVQAVCCPLRATWATLPLP